MRDGKNIGVIAQVEKILREIVLTADEMGMSR